ncbi:NGFI-A-binding protein 1-like isoform X3 [Mytilus edulis]|uniref:NGFI-A-binding protein 1-like isoform X3 n=1 Tax=Mytilus edulis TaxID=6550 RepID=UPI0039EEC6A4
MNGSKFTRLFLITSKNKPPFYEGEMTTSQPKNTSEWQLHRVLQRANLLQYYDTFISQGGDDVQQLCEAGEEEFLEIMALVGMASKPLHVRRLQKALQEWVANPAAFQGQIQMPMIGTPPGATGNQSSQLGQTVPKMNLNGGQVNRDQANPYQMHSSTSPVMNARSWSPSPLIQPTTSPGPANMVGGNQSEIKEENSHSQSPIPTPVLVESQINAIAEAATNIAKAIPYFEAKPLNMKKQINKDIMALQQQPDDSPNRLDEMRKYAAIYGRFDSKRKNIKPMSMHEISVNEAAAQLCLHMPTLLTRREDLFPLARQVVKDSGYQYSKGHSRLICSTASTRSGETVLPSAKRSRLDPTFLKMLETYPGMYVPFEFERSQVMNDRMSAVIKEIGSLNQTQDEFKKQIQAAQERGDIETAKPLQDQYDQNVTKLEKLLSEQAEMKKVNKFSRMPKLGFDDDDISSDLQSGGSSPSNSADGDDFAAHLRAQFDPNAKTKLLNDTLFDEGLRIAQQYGMADFAKELKGLQVPGEEDEEPSNIPTFNNNNGQSQNSIVKNPANESPQNNHVISDTCEDGKTNELPVNGDS